MEVQSLAPHELKVNWWKGASKSQTMKCLYSQLISLVRHSGSGSQELSSLADQLAEVTNYITKLKARVEKLKDRRASLSEPKSLSLVGRTSSSKDFLSPEILIHQMGSVLEVVLISNKSSCQLIFTEIVRVLQGEGVEILSANLSVIGDIAFHCVHSEVEDSAGNNGTAAAVTVTERLKRLLHDRCIV